MYRELCGIEVEEHALSVCGAFEQDAWGTWTWGGLPDYFRSLATHIDVKVVLLRTNTQSIIGQGFGTNISVTFAAVWSPGMAEAKVHHTTHEME